MKLGFEARCNKSGVSLIEAKTDTVSAHAKAEGGLYILLHAIAKNAERACLSVVQDSQDGENGEQNTCAFKTTKTR